MLRTSRYDPGPPKVEIPSPKRPLKSPSSTALDDEKLLRHKNVPREQRKAWKAALRASERQNASLRFSLYEQLYLLNLHSQKLVDLLREIDEGFDLFGGLSAYYRSQIQGVRALASQNIVEFMNDIEITDSVLFATLCE